MADQKIDSLLGADGDYITVPTGIYRNTKSYILGSSSGNHYAKIATDTGDLGIYSATSDNTSTPAADGCVWGVYNAIDGLSFYNSGKKYLATRIFDGIHVYPQGTWDFSQCTNVVFPKITFG